MQIKELETFLCVTETGGFHAAARKLNVTQTAVSARIRQLEDATGKALFNRGAGGTTLTDFGHQFRPYAEQMLSLWSFASRDLPAQSQNRVALRLGAQLSIWDPLLVDLAVLYEQRFGKLLLTLNYDHTLNMAEAVATHVLDMALTHEKPTGSGIACHNLPSEQLVLVESNVKGEPDGGPVFVNLELGERYQEHIRSITRQTSGQTVFLGNCMMALRYLLRRKGRGYFPAHVVTNYLESGDLQRVTEVRPLVLPVYLLTRRESEQQELAEGICQCLSDLRS
ncbi:MAG: LysR family transcriptional regulator [Ruegeria sp.]